MAQQKGYEFVYNGFVRIWLSALFIIFIRPPVEWFWHKLSPEFWTQFYSYGVAYLVVSWFFMLARHQDQDLKEKYERYRIRKRLEAAEARSKQPYDQNPPN